MPQRNSPERDDMLLKRRVSQLRRERPAPTSEYPYGKPNMPGGERRYQARLKARDEAAKAN